MSLSYNINADAIINNARKVFPDRLLPEWINDETILNEENMTSMQNNLNSYSEKLAQSIYAEVISKLNTSNKYDEYILRAVLEQIASILTSIADKGIDSELLQVEATCYNKDGIDKSTEQIYVMQVDPEDSDQSYEDIEDNILFVYLDQ